jgi:hypothetical protein
LLKQEKQNELYNEFLKFKKKYEEEYLKQKEYEDDKTRYKNMYRKIPYISLSSPNVDDDINKNQTDIDEKTKSKTPSIRNSILKNKSNILINIAREREKRQAKRYAKVDNKDSILIDVSGKKVREKETKEIELQNSLKKL